MPCGYLSLPSGLLAYHLLTTQLLLACRVALSRLAKYGEHMTYSPTNPDSEVADRINTVLINKNIRVTSLSEQTGIADKTLRRSLSGGRSLTIRELDSIARALDVSPSLLLPATHTQVAAA